MSAQITHRVDRDTGRLVQIVPPAVLRRVLDDSGDTHARPSDVPPDAWDCGGCDCEHCAEVYAAEGA